ncbi:MAG: hypothetical protein NUW02_02865 [Candidatus Campbellbacteria bacterium]|nr:hypothetical protein [Candidatus Campbellbacteria bacterium]
MFQKYKKIIGVVLGILILFVLYSMFFKKAPEATLTSSNTSTVPSADNELLLLLSQLKTIDLDGAFFSDQLFLSLTDFSVSLTLEPRQRPNPFAPIGSDGVERTTTQPTQQGTSSVESTGL